MEKLIINQMNTELNEIKENHWGILIKHLKEIEQLKARIKEKMSTLMDLKSGYPWLFRNPWTTNQETTNLKNLFQKLTHHFLHCVLNQ